MNGAEFKYIELEQSKVTDEVIGQVDCGTAFMT